MMQDLEKFAAHAYSSKETIQNTFDMAACCTTVEGCYVECGVAAGAQIGVMGYALDMIKSNQKIYAYDSFQGIPFCSENDDQEPGLYYLTEPKPFVEDKRTLLKSTGATVHSLESVKENINRWGFLMDRFVFIKGWFQDTVHTHTLPIALLRLDGDLYESTKVCLEHLFPLVSEGGVVIIDDYALSGCQKACKEYFDSIGYVPDYKTIINSEPVYFIK